METIASSKAILARGKKKSSLRDENVLNVKSVTSSAELDKKKIGDYSESEATGSETHKVSVLFIFIYRRTPRAPI